MFSYNSTFLNLGLRLEIMPSDHAIHKEREWYLITGMDASNLLINLDTLAQFSVDLIQCIKSSPQSEHMQ